MREAETLPFDTALPKTVFITFLLHVCSSANREIREWNDARMCVRLKKIHRATRWRFGDICPPLPADERQKCFKNSFPSTENIATGEKVRFYSASNYPASLILKSRDRKWLEDYTMQISDYNVWLICVNPCAFVRQRDEKSRKTVGK